MKSRQTSSPHSGQSAWLTGVQMLARRELSVVQVRDRLSQRGYDEAAIDIAISRLQASGALDDGRVARASARTRAHVKRQGRERVLREIVALGIARDVAERAVAEEFGSVDERALLEQALARRLRGDMSLSDPAARRRVFQALVRQGFSAHAVAQVLRGHSRARSEDSEM
jgi:regulatory protein